MDQTCNLTAPGSKTLTCSSKSPQVRSNLYSSQGIKKIGSQVIVFRKSSRHTMTFKSTQVISRSLAHFISENFISAVDIQSSNSGRLLTQVIHFADAHIIGM